MVNLLLFGTSFTKQPRIEIESIAEAARGGVLRARVDDLLRGLRSPGGNERLEVLGGLVQRQGLDPSDPRTGVFIFENLQRVLAENLKFGERNAEAGTEPVFRDRGVSLDTGIPPNFVIEEALRELKNRESMNKVSQVGVIGPGLDFVDKQSGYDYYPQQTLQPFAVYESLLRLGFELTRVTVFDISTRVLEHLRLARERAGRGGGYTIQLPYDPRNAWTPAALQYWRAIGDRIGKSVVPIPPPRGLEARAVEIRPGVVLACEPVDLNIVLGRTASEGGLDLIVATNVFVYYERWAQALALLNISGMLKPGGMLLTNDALPEIAPIPMRKLGQTAVRYGDKHGESVYWYRRE